MKKILLSAIAFLCAGLLFAQTLSDESLRSGSLPAGWQQTDVFFQTSAGGYARFDSEANSQLTTSTFDASANATVDISLSVAKFGSGNNGPISIEYTLDGGSNWISLGNSSTPTSSTYLSSTLSIPSTSNNMMVRLNRTNSPSQKRVRDFLLVGVGTSTGNSSPSIINITNTPLEPTSLDDVIISADVTDADGIASVELQYGFTTGVYDQTPIGMTLSSGDTYTATAPIDAQVDGTSVFYQIIATDSNAMPESSTSPEQSYTVMDPIPAPSIIITELADTQDADGRFIEIYNNGAAPVDFALTPIYISRFVNEQTPATSGNTEELTSGVLNPGEYLVVAASGTNFNTAYGFQPDEINGGFGTNGDDPYGLYAGTFPNGSLFDVYGEPGVDGSGKAWYYENSRAVRNNINDMPSTTWQASSWTITSADIADTTPGEGETVTYVYDGANWAPVAPEGVSTTSDDIVVNTGAIAFTGDVDARNITVEDGATLDLGANSINLNRNLNGINTGVITGNSAILNLGGVRAQQINAELNLESLFLNNANGATLNGQVNLTGLLQLTNGVLTTNDNLTFKSTSGKTAVVGPVVSGSLMGDVTVEQYYSAQRAFRFLGSTVNMTGSIYNNWQQSGLNPGDPNYVIGNGTQITGGSLADGFDQSGTNAVSMFTFTNNATPQEWTSFSSMNNQSTNATSLMVGEPIRLFLRGDRSISLTATGNQSPTETTLSTTGTLFTGTFNVTDLSLVEGGFNFIANPYQAQVDFDALYNDSETNDMVNAYYAWDPTLGDRGGYVTYSLSTSMNNVAGSEVNQFIQPGQAFFTATAEDGDAAGLAPVLKFKESFKSINSITTNVFRNSSEYITMSIFKNNELASGKARDGVIISFDSNGNNQVDSRDLLKFLNPDENLSVQTSGSSLSITERAVPFHTEVIDLKLDGLTGLNYTFDINNSLTTLQTILVDDYLGTETTVANGSNSISVSFDSNVPASLNPNRFSLKFENSVLTVDDSAFAKAIKAYPNPLSGSELIINNLLSGEAVEIDFYNTLGQKVFSHQNSSSTGVETLNDLNTLVSGVYLIQVRQGRLSTTIKVIIE